MNFNIQRGLRSIEHPTLGGMDIVKRSLDENAIVELEKSFDGGETQAHEALAKYPIILEPLLERVGHHAMWCKNKPCIRPKLANGKKGKIPDMLLAGKGSGGIEWFIVELKSPSNHLFKKNGAFSSVANDGLCQLASYLSYAQEKQGAIRDALEIEHFKNPQGIFVIGNEAETIANEPLSELKSFWNTRIQGMQITSYSRLLSNARSLLSQQRSQLIS